MKPTKKTPPPTDTVDLSLRIAPTFGVDRETAQLHDLAILTAGREASGHGIYIDRGTLTTALAAVQSSGGKLRGAIRHPSLLDRLSGRHDRVLDMPGFFSDIRLQGDTLVAGTFEFFDTFRATSAPTVERLMEMAAKTPELFGLSAEPCGKCVWVAADGTEYPASRDPDTWEWIGAPKGIELANAGLPTLRVTHLGVAAFVDQPAANDGLFAKLSRMFGGKQLDLSSIRELATGFLAWSAEHGDAEANAFASAPTGAGRADPEHAFTSAPSDDTTVSLTMTTIADIKAKFGTDKARFSRAIDLLADDSTLSVSAIEAKLAAKDQAALQLSVTTLTTEKAELATKLTDTEAKLATVTTDRDEWKTKFEQMKASGQSAPLPLSAGGAGSEAPKELTGRARIAAGFAAQFAAKESN